LPKNAAALHRNAAQGVSAGAYSSEVSLILGRVGIGLNFAVQHSARLRFCAPDQVAINGEAA
jgi:hypothetical protein